MKSRQSMTMLFTMLAFLAHGLSSVALRRMPRGLPWTEAGSQVQGPVAL